ncbi:hypothetical protein [Opitutus terrae]|uniref:Uncharacterized protein n=1 Tax=Opitutus terrae (strain DSM 11246 / JCM 15787 / PB90-1) TaxID=452637 RepID=B1ZR04_OPITP|nr:hypothetical protein [Opitutus terrae]ACB73671.1 hypothetical protein Oter_0381 [Opitutus terrae PB90-1]
MKILTALPFSALALVALALPTSAQMTVPLTAAEPATPASELARSRPDPAANASAALNNGGNPAAAIGAAHAASRATINQAPVITGRAGTIGANGELGNAIAASSVNGVDTVGTPNSESIGMRRARFRAASAAGSPTASSAGTAGTGRTVAPLTLSASSIRTSTVAERGALVMLIEQQVQLNTQLLATAHARVGHSGVSAAGALEQALESARTTESQLHERLQAARRASALEWNDVRTVLAADYEAYERAVVTVQRLTGGAQ